MQSSSTPETSAGSVALSDDEIGGLAVVDDLVGDERRAALDGDELAARRLRLAHGRLEGALRLGEIVLAEEGLMALEHLRHGLEAGRGINLRGRNGVEAAHDGAVEPGDPGRGGIASASRRLISLRATRTVL